MNIDSQQANNIYNANGNIIFEGTAESVIAIQKANQDKLNLIYSIAYFDLLDKNLSTKPLIDRPELINQINKTLDSVSQFSIFGDPGIGKTSVIYSFIKQLSAKAVYISIKAKSELTVVLHLTNRILADAGRNFIATQDLDEAYGLLQSLLILSNQVFVIDDCEQNEELVIKLLSLDKNGCKFIYITRNKNIFSNTGTEILQVPQFNEEEFKAFLKLYDFKLNTLKYNELYSASQGNPLYLYYFSQQQITPLPKNILSYQNSIWAGLNNNQKEILSYISICHFNPTITELAGIFPTYGILPFTEEVNGMSNLVNNKAGILEIFHLSFKEHIVNYLLNNGLLEAYSCKLGAYYIEKEDLIQAAYLLIDINPEIIQKHILSIFPVLVDLGELRFALKLLKTKLSFTDSNLEIGYIYYHMSNIAHQLGDRVQAMNNIDVAIATLKHVPDKQFYFPSLMVKAMNLGERGQSEEAKALADEVFSNTSHFSVNHKGALLVNLAKIYVDLFEFELGAKASKEAYDIFQELGSTEGMLGSLVNLVSCLSQMDGYLAESELYATKILDMADEKYNYSMRTVAMNVLTSTYRKLENFEKAKFYGSEVIKLCQKYELKEKVVLNLVNYANIIRDEGDLATAIAIYDEALFYAKEYNIKRDECRIYWIKSSVSREQHDFENSIIYADKAIEAGTTCNFSYGIAYGWQQKALALSAEKLYLDAAKAYEESASNYKKISDSRSDYFSSLFLAINLYHKSGSTEDMIRVISIAVQNSNSEPDISSESLSLLSEAGEGLAIEYFERLIESYFKNKNKYNLARPVLTYLDLCAKESTGRGADSIEKVVDILLDNLTSNETTIALLGIVIQQSNDIISKPYILKLADRLKDKLPLFSLRIIDKDIVLITSINSVINLELHCGHQDIASIKALFCLSLVIHQTPDLIIGKKPFIEDNLQIIIDQYDNIIKFLDSDRQVEYPFDGIEQSIILNSDSYGSPIGIVLSPEFQSKSILVDNPESKSLLYFLTTAISKIKGAFYHKQILKSRKERKVMLERIGRLLGYESFGAQENMSEFHIDVQKLSESDNGTRGT